MHATEPAARAAPWCSATAPAAAWSPPTCSRSTAEAAAAGWRVVRVEQPWRVAGRRIAPAPPRLDEGWTAVLDALRADGGLTGPLVLGGRSAGARVACRTAADAGGGRACSRWPSRCTRRAGRRRAAPPSSPPSTVPIVVVQGETDAFGRPEDVAAVLAGRANASVYAVAGDHALKKDVDVVAAAAMSWLDELF